MPEKSTDRLTERVTEVVDAGLEIGASVARRLAGVTGAQGTARTGRTARGAIDDIVEFGAATAANIIGLVLPVARAGAARGEPSEDAATGDGSSGRTRPFVSPGSTLRVPLLVENTSQAPTRSLTFSTVSLVRVGCEDEGACTCLPSDSVAFDPQRLVVAARDFDKLTVRIAVPDGAPPGDYAATVAAGDGWFSTVISFAVVEPASSGA